MRYAKVTEGVVVSVGARPDWRTDEGEPVSDSRLAEDGYLPVVDAPPEADADAGMQIEAPFADWTVSEVSVQAVYVVEPFAPEVARANRAARVVAERARRIPGHREGCRGVQEGRIAIPFSGGEAWSRDIGVGLR